MLRFILDRFSPDQRTRRIAALLGLLVLLLLPLFLETFRVQLFGQYLCFAIAAVSLNLIWGFSGIMSLGHSLFFGIGAYVMGYYLKLQNHQVPEFLAMNGYTQVPPILDLLRYEWFAFPLILILPALVALVIGYPTFKSGIKGVYFTILSQALALAFYLFFINQQQFTGGTSGIYGFTKSAAFFGKKISSQDMIYWMFFITIGVLVGVILIIKKLLSTRSGQVLQAIRTGENRLKYLGFDPVPYKLFTFALAASMAGLAGALYAVQVGSVYPTYLSINYSIMLVIYVAAGGLGTLLGPVVGTLVLCTAGTFFSEKIPDAWWFILGAILIAVVFAFPKGVAGLMPGIEGLMNKLRPGNKSTTRGDGA